MKRLFSIVLILAEFYICVFGSPLSRDSRQSKRSEGKGHEDYAGGKALVDRAGQFKQSGGGRVENGSASVKPPVTKPCHPTPCGPNSQCHEVNKRAVCSCLTGFIGSPPNCKPECVVSKDCPKTRYCKNEKCINPCDGPGICGVGAICKVLNHSPFCNCPPGFSGDPFLHCYLNPKAELPKVDSFLLPPCRQDYAYYELSEQSKRNKLPRFGRSRPNCLYYIPHLAWNNQMCRETCSLSCGKNAVCKVINHYPICACAIGYYGDPFTSCNLIQTPIVRKQPCIPSPCGSNTICKERNGAVSCTCMPDYFGNPLDSCLPVQKSRFRSVPFNAYRSDGDRDSKKVIERRVINSTDSEVIIKVNESKIDGTDVSGTGSIDGNCGVARDMEGLRLSGYKMKRVGEGLINGSPKRLANIITNFGNRTISKEVEIGSLSGESMGELVGTSKEFEIAKSKENEKSMGRSENKTRVRLEQANNKHEKFSHVEKVNDTNSISENKTILKPESNKFENLSHVKQNNLGTGASKIYNNSYSGDSWTDIIKNNKGEDIEKIKMSKGIGVHDNAANIFKNITDGKRGANNSASRKSIAGKGVGYNLGGKYNETSEAVRYNNISESGTNKNVEVRKNVSDNSSNSGDGWSDIIKKNKGGDIEKIKMSKGIGVHDNAENIFKNSTDGKRGANNSASRKSIAGKGVGYNLGGKYNETSEAVRYNNISESGTNKNVEVRKNVSDNSSNSGDGWSDIIKKNKGGDIEKIKMSKGIGVHDNAENIFKNSTDGKGGAKNSASRKSLAGKGVGYNLGGKYNDTSEAVKYNNISGYGTNKNVEVRKNVSDNSFNSGDGWSDMIKNNKGEDIEKIKMSKGIGVHDNAENIFKNCTDGKGGAKNSASRKSLAGKGVGYNVGGKYNDTSEAVKYNNISGYGTNKNVEVRKNVSDNSFNSGDGWSDMIKNNKGGDIEKIKMSKGIGVHDNAGNIFKNSTDGKGGAKNSASRKSIAGKAVGYNLGGKYNDTSEAVKYNNISGYGTNKNVEVRKNVSDNSFNSGDGWSDMIKNNKGGDIEKIKMSKGIGVHDNAENIFKNSTDGKGGAKNSASRKSIAGKAVGYNLGGKYNDTSEAVKYNNISGYGTNKNVEVRKNVSDNSFNSGDGWSDMIKNNKGGDIEKIKMSKGIGVHDNVENIFKNSTNGKGGAKNSASRKSIAGKGVVYNVGGKYNDTSEAVKYNNISGYGTNKNVEVRKNVSDNSFNSGDGWSDMIKNNKGGDIEKIKMSKGIGVHDNAGNIFKNSTDGKGGAKTSASRESIAGNGVGYNVGGKYNDTSEAVKYDIISESGTNKNVEVRKNVSDLIESNLGLMGGRKGSRISRDIYIEEDASSESASSESESDTSEEVEDRGIKKSKYLKARNATASGLGIKKVY